MNTNTKNTQHKYKKTGVEAVYNRRSIKEARERRENSKQESIAVQCTKKTEKQAP